MRKTIAILFSLLLVCSLSFVALADAAEDPVLEPEEVMQTEISDPAEACDHEHDSEPESPVVVMSSVGKVELTSLLAEPCDECGEGTVRKTDVQRGEWMTYGHDFCSHSDYEGPVDLLQKRTVTDVYRCDSCSYGFLVFIGHDYAVYCQQRAHRYITSQI